ncbi:MAG: hypothetical protein HZB51_06020 [Chloroflexi bacterium]|nr:hypothetical protein [Chloroflexota bacterium]
MRRERKAILNVALMLLIAVVLIVPALFAGSLGMTIGQQVFQETTRTREAQSTFNYDVWQLFFALLFGAGIAEETVYRLVAVLNFHSI